ncbi:MAG: hypothetical protein QOI38_1600, partial [Sphingomonadales bacterium]|nr:hypothetical protein [Sphingomonadales bacterium]
DASQEIGKDGATAGTDRRPESPPSPPRAEDAAKVVCAWLSLDWLWPMTDRLFLRLNSLQQTVASVITAANRSIRSPLTAPKMGTDERVSAARARRGDAAPQDPTRTRAAPWSASPIGGSRPFIHRQVDSSLRPTTLLSVRCQRYRTMVSQPTRIFRLRLTRRYMPRWDSVGRKTHRISNTRALGTHLRIGFTGLSTLAPDSRNRSRTSALTPPRTRGINRKKRCSISSATASPHSKRCFTASSR